MSSKRILRTSKQIATELSCSEKTVSRMYAAGRLPGAYKLNGKTSPLMIAAKDLQKLRGKVR